MQAEFDQRWGDRGDLEWLGKQAPLGGGGLPAGCGPKSAQKSASLGSLEPSALEVPWSSTQALGANPT